MIKEILWIILLTFLPFLELRASIPYGIVMGIDWKIVFLIAVIVNILLAPLLWFFVNYVMHLFLHIKFIDKIYQKIVLKTQKKVHPYVEKYGVYGLAVFIGIPLPGSGVYSGTLGAYLLGFNFKNFIKAAILGVLIAGVIVTSVTIFGEGAIRALFLK